MINQMTIIGLGLVGKSIAKAIQSASFARKVIGFDEDHHKAQVLFNEKIIDHYQTDLISAVKNADLIIMTCGFDQYEKIFLLLADNIKDTTTITEIANIKLPVISLAKKTLGYHFPRFVPSHPIIGTINTKKSSPRPEIFAQRPIIITPTNETHRRSLTLVSQFWQKLGGEIDIKPAEANDAIIACVSHLPQMLAITLINYLNDENKSLRYINQNFIDLTNMTTKSPLIWSDICITNRKAILKELTKFEANLKKLKKIIESEDAEILLQHFNNTKQLSENI